jgi:uncharacterized membrane protein YjgN (DUF898 family)
MSRMRGLDFGFTGSADGLRQAMRRDRAINLLLGGLYTPVVRRRTADYLLAHTSLGSTPFGRVPVERSRWPAVAVVAAFLLLRIGGEFGWGPPLPLVILAGVWMLPWLWATIAARAIDGTRWATAQFRFAARGREVYAASWPLLLIGTAWAAAEPAVADALGAATQAQALRMATYALPAAASALPLLAVWGFNLQRLKFTRTEVEGRFAHWHASRGAYLRIWAGTLLAVAATAVAPVVALRYALLGRFDLQGLPPEQAALAYALAFVLALLLSAPARAWHEARMFRWAWHDVRLPGRLRLLCELDVRAFVRMRSADALRSVLTLGLHAPAAAVNAHAAKLHALRVQVVH